MKSGKNSRSGRDGGPGAGHGLAGVVVFRCYAKLLEQSQSLIIRCGMAYAKQGAEEPLVQLTKTSNYAT